MNTALSMLVGFGTEEFNVRLNRYKRLGIAYALAGVFLLIAVSCALVAGIIWLAEIYGPILAPLFVAAGFVVLAIICMIVVSVANAAERRRMKSRRAARQSAMIGAALPLAPLIVKSRLLLGLTALGGSAFLASRYFGVGPAGRDDDR